MSLPHYLTRDHILHGLKYIDEHGVPSKREATGYLLKWKGKDYPPKYTICVAHLSYDGKQYPSNVFRGGTQANNFLIFRRFRIWNIKARRWVGLEPVVEDESKVFEEGAVAYRKHLGYEKDARIAKLAKEKRLAERHDLRCDVCDFSFSQIYGSLGAGYIEAHHTIPVSQMAKLKKKNTKLSDIALVCSNCHRMLHRYIPWLGIAELKRILASNSGNR